MKVEKVRIQNLRGFKDEEIVFDDYTCFVGSNGAGKSTVLCALNIFFRETENAATNLSELEAEDFHNRDTTEPVEITVTFKDLTPDEQSEFAAYYRQDRLIVTAKAVYDQQAGHAVVRQFGNRMAMEEFRPYFDGMKAGMSAGDLKIIFDGFRSTYPDIPSASSKEARATALQEYEAQRADLCVLVASEDMFYGVGQAGKLRRFVQWIYIPAVKDASDEQAEAKNTAFGRLVSRTVRAKVNFLDELAQLRLEAEAKYGELIAAQQGVLDEVSGALQARLAEWSVPNATARLNWHQDPKTAVRVEEPTARLTAGDGHFEGSIARFGHGMQRSYLIALLQGLASIDDSNQPKLILGIEEPELYQHPPQARHLASVLEQLSGANTQVVLSTHSPYFVDGKGFESVRLVQKDESTRRSHVKQMTFEQLSASLSAASGEAIAPIDAMLAKLHQALQPALTEIFFTGRLVLVEGLEDQAYITAWLKLTGRWEAFRKGGCHIVAAGGKSELARPLAIALGLGIPVFVLFDADCDKLDHSDPNTAASRRAKHSKDNLTILALVGGQPEAFPDEVVWAERLTVWPTDLADTVKRDVGDDAWSRYGGAASVALGGAGNLQKNTLHIAERLFNAFSDNARPDTLEKLGEALLQFAGAESAVASAEAAAA
jgi:predicted ATPase